ncbi:MAG: stage III sporulation protein AE [Clostridia bacterium]|nr:stage III sporulation protein AE [Clostridia bacterium]
MKIKIVLMFFLLCIFSVPANAANIDEYKKDIYESSGADKLHEFLDEESEEFLKRTGLDGIDTQAILDFSPSALFSAVTGVFREKWKEPARALVSAAGTAIMISVCTAIVPDDEKSKSVVSLAGACFAVSTLFKSVFESVRACASCVEACVGFEKLLIPVLTALLTASGKPASAISYNGASFFISESVSMISESVILPVTGVAAALYLCSGIMPEITFNSVADVIRKAASYILSVSAALFSGTIAIKSVIASSSDSIGAKAVKLVTSTFVPVVGGALGEAFNSFAGSISLFRNTVGIFGIVALGAICIPVLVQTLLWILSMRAASAISEMLGCRCCVMIYNGIAYICSMMNTLLLFCVTVFVISSATVIVVAGG